MTDIVKDNNPDFDKCLNIDDYEGDDVKEKYILYCNEDSYKNKLQTVAKSECYNKTKELKINNI